MKWTIFPHVVATTLLLTSAPTAVAQSEAEGPSCGHFNDLSEETQIAWTIGLYQGARAAEKIFKGGVDRISTQLTGADSAEFAEAVRELTSQPNAKDVPPLSEMPMMLQMVFLARTPLYGAAGMSYQEIYHRVAAVCSRSAYADTLVTDAFVEVLGQLGSNLDP